MSTWIISITVSVIITTILTILLPNGKLKVLIKGAFSLIITLVMLQPLLDLKNSEFEIDGFVSETNMTLQYDYLGYVAEEKVKFLEVESVKIIEDVGIRDAAVQIKYYMTENGEVVIEKAKIFLYDSVIISNIEHIDIIEEIKQRISNYLNVNKNSVIIYERKQ
jgi:stage III sporulation protein AF